jgi:hypothetical protein
VTAEEGENCIPIHEAYALASGALLKVQSFGVKASLTMISAHLAATATIVR